jgi:hypothetical protein
MGKKFRDVVILDTEKGIRKNMEKDLWKRDEKVIRMWIKVIRDFFVVHLCIRL